MKGDRNGVGVERVHWNRNNSYFKHLPNMCVVCFFVKCEIVWFLGVIWTPKIHGSRSLNLLQFSNLQIYLCTNKHCLHICFTVCDIPQWVIRVRDWHWRRSEGYVCPPLNITQVKNIITELSCQTGSKYSDFGRRNETIQSWRHILFLVSLKKTALYEK